MPGPVSDSYDPEWGTAENGARIAEALSALYAQISGALGYPPPRFILDLLEADLSRPVTLTLTEREWRLLRFALERAGDSI